MFERRLKLFLLAVFIATFVLAVRAVQVQLVQGAQWRARAAESMKRYASTDTTRGRILDFRGRALALDEPCTDAAVEYRALVRDEVWMRQEAIDRLSRRPGSGYKSADRSRRAELLKQEIAALNADLDRLWQALADVSGKSLEEIEQTKSAIRQRVEMRRRYVWYRKYEQALEKRDGRGPAPWYRQWLVTGGGAPQLDNFAVTVEEELASHVILRAIDDETYMRLGRMQENLPGLELRHGKRRLYPRGDVAAHLIGNLSIVTREDLDRDPDADDERRQYLPNDLIGRSGVEAMCERLLRGSRGRVERQAGSREPLRVTEAQPGQDVHLTIDAELQADIMRAMLKERQFRNEAGEPIETRSDMHGAAVVVDVPTGEVRAMVSCPSYDLNRFDAEFARMARDEINKPLLNRATQMALEPGSTVKLIVALGGMHDGFIKPDSTVECTGYLVLHGTRYLTGRCWIARQYAHLGIDVRHHKHPANAPHPTGFLNVTDAIERSCNIFFETTADAMGIDRIAQWFSRFGLGHRTGIGVSEAAGRVPDARNIPRGALSASTWYAGIGQGPISATPLQMANVAATVARDGLWKRPRLIVGDGPARAVRAATGPSDDEIDLKLDKAQVAAVRQGMMRVVNSAAGTGPWAWREDMHVAGKTGSAQAGVLRYPRRDEGGAPVYRESVDSRGRPVRRIEWVEVAPNTYPWYQGTGENRQDLSHAWFIGFAPAEKPRIAFAVLIEYGGSGGRVAGSVAKDVLEAAVQHGYLTPPGR